MLKESISLAKKGDNPHEDILWQTILSQVTPLLKLSYLNLSASERLLFETKFKSVFMTYATVIPLLNAEKIYALMESCVLIVKKLQTSYQLKTASNPYHFKFCYQDDTGKERSCNHHFVGDARGQSVSYQTNPSKLARNILSSGLIHLEEYQTSNDEKLLKNLPIEPGKIRNGGLWINPKTHQVIKKQEPNSHVQKKYLPWE